MQNSVSIYVKPVVEIVKTTLEVERPAAIMDEVKKGLVRRGGVLPRKMKLFFFFLNGS